MLPDRVRKVRSTRKKRGQQVTLTHGASDLTDHNGRFGLDHRHLRNAVLAQDLDGVPHGLGGVGVHQGRQIAGLGREHLGEGSLTLVMEKAVRRHPAVVEDLGEVTPTAVWQYHHDDRIRRQVASRTQGGNDGHTAGASHEQPLFERQPPCHGKGLGV